MSNTDFMTEVDRFIDEKWEEIVEEIARLVSIPSVADFDRATPEDPSGPEAHDGLRAAVDLAQRLGFDARDDAGQIGIADLKGESDTMLGMICHSDVVAPGVGRSTPGRFCAKTDFCLDAAFWTTRVRLSLRCTA